MLDDGWLEFRTLYSGRVEQPAACKGACVECGLVRESHALGVKGIRGGAAYAGRRQRADIRGQKGFFQGEGDRVGFYCPIGEKVFATRMLF